MSGTPYTPSRGKKKLITAYVKTEAAEEVLRRAERLGWSLSKTAGTIIDQWHANGGAALTALDRQAVKKSKT